MRIQIYSFWQSFTFVLNGLVFVLIGLQLPFILNSIREYSKGRLVLDGAVFSLLLIALRLVWVFPSARISYSVSRLLGKRHEQPPVTRQVFVIGWTGMRGVVSLAAALSLPAVLDSGKVFPERDLIVFLTFCVILVTLVLQGITLPPLVRALGLSGANGPDCEEQDARRLVTQAAVSHLEAARLKDTDAAREVYEDILGHYRQRLASLQPGDQNPEGSLHHQRLMEISRDAEQIERQTAVQLRNEGRINDAVLRKIERELDLNETRFTNGDDE